MKSAFSIWQELTFGRVDELELLAPGLQALVQCLAALSAAAPQAPLQLVDVRRLNEYEVGRGADRRVFDLQEESGTAGNH